MLALALPLVANSAVQTILNLTDLWFIGHISTTALAAVGAVNWLVVAVVLLLAGTGMAVQTCVAQCLRRGAPCARGAGDLVGAVGHPVRRAAVHRRGVLEPLHPGALRHRP